MNTGTNDRSSTVGLDTQKSGFGCPKSVWEMDLAGFGTLYNDIPAIRATKIKCFSSWKLFQAVSTNI